MLTNSVAYRSLIAVDLFNIRNKKGGIFTKRQEFSADFLIHFVENLEKLELKLPIIYLGDSHLPWILKKFRQAGQEQWIERRISLPDEDPQKFWFVSKEIEKADYIILNLHNQFGALVISRDKFRKEVEKGIVHRAAELLRFEARWDNFNKSSTFIGQTYGCLNKHIGAFDKPELDTSRASEIREIAVSSIKNELQEVKQKYSSKKSQSFWPRTPKKPDGTNKDELEENQSSSTGQIPAPKFILDLGTKSFVSVSLYNTDAMLEAHDTDVLLIGTPAFDHHTSLWVLKWPMYPTVVHLSPEASAAIANLSETPSLLGLKGHLKQLPDSGDVYELSHFVGLVHGLDPELFPEKPETSVIFSKWGYSLAHQLHQWRVRNTKVIEFPNSKPAESSHPDSVNSQKEDSQSVIKPEPSPDVHPPESPPQPIPTKPVFRPPTPPPTTPPPRVIKSLSPVDKTPHEKPSSTANQSPATDSTQEPERSHTDSEKNSKWAIVWVMAAVASLLAVISQIL